MGTESRIQKNMVEDRPILLFDGVCNFCDSTVQFILKHNKSKEIHFASLQSAYGQEILKKAKLPTKDLKSLIFIKDGKIYTKSTGALKLTPYLGIYKFLYIFMVVPTPIRNFVYDWVAKNRYKWFGQKDACSIPSPETRKRFIKV